MGVTIPNTKIDSNDWLDINTATSIAAGTAIRIQNISDARIKIVVKATTPNDSDGFNIIDQVGQSGAWFDVEADVSNPIVWCKAKGGSGAINVQDAS